MKTKKNPSPSFVGKPWDLNRYDLLVVVFSIIFAVFFSIISLYRLSVFDPQFDTVIFNQAFWNTIHYGELLTNSLEMGSHFGVHFSPILFTILPLYYVIPGPETLFILKTILITLGVVPVYLCAREYLGPKYACVVSLIYFLYPSVQGVAYCDFYETSFFPLFIGLVLWAYLSKRENLMLICGCACLLIKEDVSLLICMVGLVGFWSNRSRPLKENWRYILLIVIPIVVLLSFFLVIKPALSTGNLQAANQFLDQYKNIPGNLSDHNGNRIYYLFQLFAPLLFIPLAAFSVLVIAIPSFLEILLSPNPEYFYVGQHYSALVIPIIFMSLIIGIKKIAPDSPKKLFSRKNLLSMILLCSLVATLLWSPVIPPLQYAIQGGPVPTWEHGPTLHRIMGIIPEDVSVAAPMNILPFLTNRHELFMDYNPGADIILLDAKLPEYADVFQNNIGEIKNRYDLVLNVEGASLYVKKNSTDLATRIQNEGKRVGILKS